MSNGNQSHNRKHVADNDEIVTTRSPRDGVVIQASRLGLSHWAGPSVTGSARGSQRVYRGVMVVILAKGK